MDRPLAPRARTARTFGVVAALALGLAGCGGPSGEGAPATGAPTAADTSAGRIEVVASFYPLAYAVERVGGDLVQVTNLTKPGVEPHDLELTPQDVATVSTARLAVYEKNLQPAVDTAITEQQVPTVLDVSESADLTLTEPEAIGGGHSPDDGHDHASEAGATDPHFWLDPIRYQKVAQAIATELGNLDPAHKGDFYENFDTFSKELTTLDGDFSAGLRQCASKDLVTSHAAFGYLADRYGLNQVPIAGLTPDAEPEPARIAQIADYVRSHHVTTIYTETLVNPAVAQTVAAETGATTAVLDPIEGVIDSSAGQDYLEIMRANLTTLQKGQQCT